MPIGHRLKAERKRLGLNQTDFAALAGVQISAQTNYENDKRQPDAKYLAAIAAAGVDVGYITTGVRRGQEHTTSAAQLTRMKALASVLADELHRRQSSLSEVRFYELLDTLWEGWRDDESADKARLVKRIGELLK